MAARLLTAALLGRARRHAAGPYLAALWPCPSSPCRRGRGSSACSWLWLTHRRRFAESLRVALEPGPARDRLRRALWEIARGPAISRRRPSEAELGKRYVALLAENLGQPGFRELILRAADLETGRVLPFVVLDDAHRAAFAVRAEPRGPAVAPRWPAGRGRPARSRLRRALLRRGRDRPPVAPGVGPVRRVSFPQGRPLRRARPTGSPTPRLVAGAASRRRSPPGAEQVIVVLARSRQEAGRLPRRRGRARPARRRPRPTLERQAVEVDLQRPSGAHQPHGRDPRPSHGRRRARLAGPGHRPRLSGRRRSTWSARTRRVARPARAGRRSRSRHRGAWPPRSDLVERGYRDAYRLFVEPVVGAVPAPRRLRRTEPRPRRSSCERGEGRRRAIAARRRHTRRSRQSRVAPGPAHDAHRPVLDVRVRLLRRDAPVPRGRRGPAFDFYTRYANPTLRALEEALAALEGAEAGVVFASGMAAMTTGILSVLRGGRRGPGQRVALRRHDPVRARPPADARGWPAGSCPRATSLKLDDVARPRAASW